MGRNRVIAVLSALCILSLSVMVLVLNREPRTGEFIQPPFEPAAQTGMPEVPEGLGYQQLDAQVFQVALCGELHVRDGAAEVWFTNPDSNRVWLKLRVLDEEGRILGETGLLRPGEYVRQVALTEAGPGTPVALKVMAYEPETCHSAGAMTFSTRIAAE